MTIVYWWQIQNALHIAIIRAVMNVERRLVLTKLMFWALMILSGATAGLNCAVVIAIWLHLLWPNAPFYAPDAVDLMWCVGVTVSNMALLEVWRRWGLRRFLGE